MNLLKKISGIIITIINCLYIIYPFTPIKIFEKNNEEQIIIIVIIIFILQIFLTQKTIINDESLNRLFFIINCFAIVINIILVIIYLIAPDLSKYNSLVYEHTFKNL